MSKAQKQEKSMEAALWESANKLRGNVEPSEYKHVVLSLIFLKYASDKFEDRRKELIDEGKGAYVEMVDFYTMKNVFYLAPESRWSYIMEQSKQSDIALKIDTALYTIEKNNPTLKGALPDNYYSRLGLDTAKLASLLDEINKIELTKDNEQDVMGRVYEYFLADLGEIIGGATPSKDNAEYFCDNGVVWLTPKDLTSTGLKFIYKGETDITQTAYQSCSTKIMPQGTVLLTSRAPVGSVAIAMVDLCTNQGFKSIVPKKKIGTAYVYYFLKENKQLLDSHSSGTTFMEISGNVLKSIPTKIPPYILTEKFTQLCKPIFSYQAKLEFEIMKLNQLLAVINSSLVSC